MSPFHESRQAASTNRREQKWCYVISKTGPKKFRQLLPTCFRTFALWMLPNKCSISRSSGHAVRSLIYIVKPHIGSLPNSSSRAQLLSYPGPGTRQLNKKVPDDSSPQLFGTLPFIWVLLAKVPNIVEERQTILFYPVWVPDAHTLWM